MLHIKSNNEPVVGVDTTNGTSRPLGSMQFVKGAYLFNVYPTQSSNLVFTDKWAALQSSYISGQINENNILDSSQAMTAMSFVGSSDIFLDINTQHNLKYYGSTDLKLVRNSDQHLRETDAFSLRVGHRIGCTAIADGQQIERKATFKTATVADEATVGYHFTPHSFFSSGWDYIKFFNQNGEEISQTNISGIDPVNGGLANTNWVDFNPQKVFTKDNIQYYPHDCYLKKVGTNTELHSAQVMFTSSGLWDITFDSKIAQAYKNLATGKMLRIRFVFAISRTALLGQADAIPTTFFPSTKLARPSKLVSSTFNEAGTNGTFVFNRQCYVSVYRNGVQITDKALTTTEGELTVNFVNTVHVGANIELRVTTAYPQTEYSIFTVNVADTTPPPPIIATLFLENRIFGSGGSAGDTAVAERDGVIIGQAEISSTLEYIMVLNAGVTLTTGELIEVYAMDTARNRSESELYEIEVSISVNGAFNPNLGNDSLTSVTTIS